MAALADPTFQKKLDETSKDSETALEELEKAISSAEQRSKATATFLEQQKAAEEPEEGSKPG